MLRFNKNLVKKLFIEAVFSPFFYLKNFKMYKNLFRNILYFSDTLCLFNFLTNKSSGDVLYIEPSDAHAELLPGYLKIFIDNGYKVDVLIDSSVSILNPLCFFNSNNYKLFTTNIVFLKFILKFNRASSYKFIFVSTNEIYQFNKELFCNIFLEYCKKNFDKLLIVEHNLKNIKRYNRDLPLYDSKKLAVIKNFKRDKMLCEVVPDYFGEIPKKMERNCGTKFIIVGSLDLRRRNPNLIVEGVKYLLENFYYDFCIFVIGETGSFSFPSEYKKYIRIMGKLDFSNMLVEVQSSDFFLPLFDYNVKEHRKYISNVCSGSFQLIYGLSIPSVINNKFAEVYGLNGCNSVLYSDNQIGFAMRKAIDTPIEKRQMMKNMLKSGYNERLYTSICNISNFI